MAKSDLLSAALALARQGYRVFPCVPGNKRPAVRGGFKAATRDPGTIRRWWSRWPNANVAVATHGVIVVDVDPAGGGWPPEPEQRAAIRATGCPVARTPRGGWHLWFRLPGGRAWRCSANQLAPGVDVRAAGGYVLVPPSRTAAGQYQWARPLVPADQLPLPPQWLIEALDQLVQPARHAPINGHQLRPPLGQRPSGAARRGAKLRLGQPGRAVAARGSKPSGVGGGVVGLQLNAL